MPGFCQGNKDGSSSSSNNIPAQWTGMQIRPWCKCHTSSGAKQTVFIPPPQHNTLLSVQSETPPAPLSHCNTSRSTSTIARDNIIFLLHCKQRAGEQWALYTQTHTLRRGKGKKKDKPLTCLSWRRLANTDSLKLLFTGPHTVGNGRGRGPGANVTTAVCERERKREGQKAELGKTESFIHPYPRTSR